MPRSDWQARVVDRLIDAKRSGETDFDCAWRSAIGRAIIPASDDGGYNPTLFGGEETIVGFFRRACEAAWDDTHDEPGSGNGPRVKEFRIELLADLHLTAAA